MCLCVKYSRAITEFLNFDTALYTLYFIRETRRSDYEKDLCGPVCEKSHFNVLLKFFLRD